MCLTKNISDEVKMEIRKTTRDDLDRVMEIYAIARDFMAKTGNPNQWKTHKPQRELIEKDIPEQKISLVSELTKNQKERIIETLLAGNIEFQKYPSNQTEDGYSLMRKFGLILLRDITKGRKSPVKEAFSSLLTPEKEDVIRQHFLAHKTDVVAALNMHAAKIGLADGGGDVAGGNHGHGFA